MASLAVSDQQWGGFSKLDIRRMLLDLGGLT